MWESDPSYRGSRSFSSETNGLVKVYMTLEYNDLRIEHPKMVGLFESECSNVENLDVLVA